MTYNVNVYSQPSCAPCRLTKKILSDGGVTFTEFDVSTNPDLADQLRAMGYQGVPVVTVELEDGIDHWQGVDRDRLKALVAIAGRDS